MTDWREQVADERVQLFDNGGPNAVHAEPCIEAARNGKHVLCEKPLGLSAEESHRMWQEAERAGVVHMCGFNYRFVPAVRLAREMLEAGDLGDLFHFRARYLQSWGVDAPPSWRPRTTTPSTGSASATPTAASTRRQPSGSAGRSGWRRIPRRPAWPWGSPCCKPGRRPRP